MTKAPAKRPGAAGTAHADMEPTQNLLTVLAECQTLTIKPGISSKS